MACFHVLTELGVPSTDVIEPFLCLLRDVRKAKQGPSIARKKVCRVAFGLPRMPRHTLWQEGTDTIKWRGMHLVTAA